jgi:hypothetical protein
VRISRIRLSCKHSPAPRTAAVTGTPRSQKEKSRQAERPPSYRRGTCVQAEFLSSYQSKLAFRPLRSTIVTRFIATMSLSDSRSKPPHGYVFPHVVGGSPTARPGLPGSLTDLSTRAVPYHPGKPDDCSRPLLHRRLQASSSLADWPLPLCVTRPNQVRLRYGSRVRFSGLHRADRSTAVPESLSAERVIRRVNSFQFTRSARLGLAHQRTQRKTKRNRCGG